MFLFYKFSPTRLKKLPGVFATNSEANWYLSKAGSVGEWWDEEVPKLKKKSMACVYVLFVELLTKCESLTMFQKKILQKALFN